MRAACIFAILPTLFLASAVEAQQTVPHRTSTSTLDVARQRWQMRERNHSGTGAAELRRQAIVQKVQQRASNPLLFTVAGWNSLGPSPLASDASGMGLQDYNWVSGKATAVVIDPNDPTGNTVYAGGGYGGVWKSSSAGPLISDPNTVSWAALTDDQPTLAVGAIAIQPQLTNPDPSNSLVLVGTGGSDSSADTYYGLGILRSTDGGNSWTLITQDASGTRSFAGMGFSRIAFSTANPNLVVAGTASSSQGMIEGLENPPNVNRGIYYSTDAGLAWNLAIVSDAGASIAPGASVSSVAYNAAAGTFYAAVRFHGFYSSSDGIHWTRLAVQPGPALAISACPTQAANSSCPIYRGEIAVVPNRSGPSGMGEMYAWYVDGNDKNQGIWKTVNGGASWTQINDSGITNCGDLDGCGTENGTSNLALAAVPNGTATDIYAGAVNLYKCTITNANPTCAGSGNNTFMNLTHVYGCSDIARVHPGQHAIDFLVNAGTALLYFANDGGIYRALDGFLGLRAGTCGLSNQFDSLNVTLGPMTQFTSVSQSSTDVNLIFGGAQENGVPATAFSQSGGAWINVSAGEVGFTAINPADDNEWLVAQPPDLISGVNLFRCTNGVNCHTQDFASDQIVDSNALGGDSGGFNVPFIFDSASSDTLLIGTCRLWRGPSSGGGFASLSPNFETGGTGVCSGSETNLVRSIEAGGPVDSNGWSQVIYAGTDGDGPLGSTGAQGGRIWITTSADAGPTAWIDRTAGINPQGFPISSIAIDGADPTGQTAYLGIMGFRTAHIWKTTNAGASWIDFTANLPDAPVDSVVIDSGTSTASGTVYAGTDVGVFASNTGLASWSEVPSSGGAGVLPNVAITALKIFNSGGIKRLRAATYGRGVWELDLITTPDFQVTVANTPQVILVGQSATFNGTIFARNGYSSVVTLGCVSGNTAVPQTCSISPSSVTPTAQGTPFTINAAGAAGDYSFNLQATGSDAAQVSHQYPIVLHVTDFSLGAPSPNSVAVAPGANSSPVSFTVSPDGAFTGQVTLTCTGLPVGTACQFQPANVIAPSSVPVAASMTVAAAITSPPGTYQVKITASSPGAITKTQLIFLTVNFVPDYIVEISNPSLTAQVNSPAVFNGTITPVNGYNSLIDLGCGAGAPSNCVVSPATITPSLNAVPFTVTVSSAISQAFAFNVDAAGADVLTVRHSEPVAFTAMPAQGFDFTLSMTPPNVSISPGQSAPYSLDLSPTTGTFPSNVTFTCSGLPALASCSFSPPQVTAGSGNSPIIVTISTTSATSANIRLQFFWTSAPLLGTLFMFARKRRIIRKSYGLLLLLLSVAFSSTSCGGGLQGNGTVIGSGNPGTPAGTYNIKVSAATAVITHTVQASLTVSN